MASRDFRKATLPGAAGPALVATLLQATGLWPLVWGIIAACLLVALIASRLSRLFHVVSVGPHDKYQTRKSLVQVSSVVFASCQEQPCASLRCSREIVIVHGVSVLASALGSGCIWPEPYRALQRLFLGQDGW